ncbi:uncharacterized protein LOC126890432 [Diabrotica virgifera virgifera]|uniref:MADF domain-containing protein n=1 Tax=Diabrotica virgifera virgifera TaxID=50390 RepID=A0ABM5KYP4_DIAVI|nr:uncharacterized protein LOC126890432 [Diabrotica virgifera virgifera]
MDVTINPEDLIPLVQERGVLWDKTLDSYKEKPLKVSAWQEICCQLIPDYEDLDERERRACGKLVSTRWANLRDAWLRATKNEVRKSEAGAKFSKPYIYKRQMSFLHKAYKKINRTHDSREPRSPILQKRLAYTFVETPAVRKKEKRPEVPMPRTSKKPMRPMPSSSKKPMTLDDKMSLFLDSMLSTDKREEHPMLSFFKGVLPSVTSFDEDETLEFHSGVLSLIQKIRKQRGGRL